MGRKKKHTDEERKQIREEYVKEHYEIVMYRVPKGGRQFLKHYASQLGISVNQFINQSIQEKINRINESKGGNHAKG